jgi:hypothetical protein
MNTTTLEPTRGPAPDFALDGRVALVTGQTLLLDGGRSA